MAGASERNLGLEIEPESLYRTLGLEALGLSEKEAGSFWEGLAALAAVLTVRENKKQQKAFFCVQAAGMETGRGSSGLHAC